MSNWIHSTLEQICVPDKGAIISGPFGSNISSKFFVSQGVPVIRGNNLTLGKEKFIDNGFAYITPEKAEELNCYALKNDLVFTAAGTLGQVGVLTGDLRYEKYVISNKQLRARIDSSKVDLLYAYYWYSSPWMQQYFITNNKGSTVPLVTLSELKSAPITYPESIEEQRKIASIFDDITTKIDLNTRLCSELEAMAKTLYDYWFVQFDFPDENGKPYRTSGGAMERCQELGREVPKGWKVGNLYDIADYINGLACQNFRPAEGEESLPVIKIKEMHDGITLDTERVSARIPEKNIINDGDILFSWSATLEVMYWTGGKGGLNQHIFKVVPKAHYQKEFVYNQLSSYIINFVKMAEARKTTMGHITSDHLQQSRIVLPPVPVLRQFHDEVSAQHQMIIKCRKENRELEKLRDWLLPMLMNGQAYVKVGGDESV